jgi:hypothetical protein
MNDINPYESPQTIDDVKEKQPTEKIPKLAILGAGLMFICLGLFIVALLITLCDPFFIEKTEGKPPIDSYVSLKYGIPTMKIGVFSGIVGMVLITLSLAVQRLRKRASRLENKTVPNG